MTAFDIYNRVVKFASKFHTAISKALMTMIQPLEKRCARKFYKVITIFNIHHGVVRFKREYILVLNVKPTQQSVILSRADDAVFPVVCVIKSPVQ